MVEQKQVRPLLPIRRPWWAFILCGMVVFGYVQEDVKIKLNHYMAVGDFYSDFYTYKYEECEWDPECIYKARRDWWNRAAPKSRNNFYVSRDTFDVFHRWDREQMLRAKWVLMVLIVGGFFLFDALFLRTAGVGERWKLLFVIYAASGLVVLTFYLLDGRGGPEEHGYNVAREVLGFLQSPMPSMLLVLLPWLRERALEGGKPA